MPKILCPTDFSEPAINATGYAAKFAQATSAELILLNVQSIFNLTPNEIVRGKELTKAAINEQLESQCKEISRTFKISCYAEVELTGHKLSSVIDEKSAGFDLIVMGTNGVSDYFEFFTGSDTYKVIKGISTPVLLIPTECAFSPISSIVYSVDLLKGEQFHYANWSPGLHHGFIEGLFHKSVTKVISSIARYPTFVFH